MSEPGRGAALSLSAARRLALSCAGSVLAAASPGGCARAELARSPAAVRPGSSRAGLEETWEGPGGR